MSEIRYRLAAATNVGLIRKNNEDNFVVCADLTSSDWQIPQVSDYADLGVFGSLLVVADGMGGANAGEVASAIAVETVQQAFTPEYLQDVVNDDKAIQEFMKEVVKAADVKIFNRSRNDSNTRGMGTTIVMAWVLNNKIYLCWCGDSRCYLLNKQKGLIRLSKDHSYVQELIDKGELDPEFAMDHPLSNVITRCLGDMQSRAVPETRIAQLHDGDTILLCSDGLSGMCNDMQILDLLIEFREDPEVCKNELISAALNEGGHDNVTVALCNIQMKQQDISLENDTPQEVSSQADDSSPTKTSIPIHQSNGKKWLWFILFIAIIGITFVVIKKCMPVKEDVKPELSPVDSSTVVIPDIIEPQDPIIPSELENVASTSVEVMRESEESNTISVVTMHEPKESKDVVTMHEPEEPTTSNTDSIDSAPVPLNNN